jgi:anti-sigma factor RsiW
MNCSESRRLLYAYVDDELDLVNGLALESHLKNCHGCAAEKNSLRSLHSAFRNSNLAYRAPDSLKKDLRQFVRDLKEEKKSRKNFDRQWLWKFLAFGATAFALLTIFLRPAGISEHDAFLDEVIASHVRSLQVEHLTDVVSSDQHTVKPWFDGKLDFAPNVKDFAADGFPLIGGRLDYLNGRAVAALVYRHNKHPINVFIWPAKNSDLAKTQIENRLGYSVIYGNANAMNYCFVSDLNEKELAALADLIEK